MDFEFETNLRNGKIVTVVGSAEIDYSCTCCDKAHIEAVDYTSVTDVNSGMDLMLDDRLIKELDNKTDNYLYGELENV